MSRSTFLDLVVRQEDFHPHPGANLDNSFLPRIQESLRGGSIDVGFENRPKNGAGLVRLVGFRGIGHVVSVLLSCTITDKFVARTTQGNFVYAFESSSYQIVSITDFYFRCMAWHLAYTAYCLCHVKPWVQSFPLYPFTNVIHIRHVRSRVL